MASDGLEVVFQRQTMDFLISFVFFHVLYISQNLDLIFFIIIEMHLSHKQRLMNQTFTILTNKYCSIDNDFEQEQLANDDTSKNVQQLSDANRFCTFTKCKIKDQSAIVSVNQNEKRYFDSPTMITLDDDDDDDEIPVSRCSNRTSINPATLNETDLSDLFVFTNRLSNIFFSFILNKENFVFSMNQCKWS